MNDTIIKQNKVGHPVKYRYENMKPVVDNWIEYAKNQVFEKVIFDPKSGEQKTIQLKKPLTIQSFILYANITRQTYLDILNDKEYKVYEAELVDMFTRIHEYIQDNQIAGAILNEYNAQIVSRINGLSDTLNVQNNVTVNALPLNIDNAIIDLTNDDYTILNDLNNNKLRELSENTLTE